MTTNRPDAATDRVFVVEFRVLVKSVSSAADVQRIKEMSDALEATARDFGGDYVIKEARWTP